MQPDPEMPEEFRQRPDNYEAPVPAWVDGAWYRDGELVHSTLRQPLPERPEEQPGWTVQGARHGQAP